MTAYGRAITQTEFGPFTVEILSVNRKYLDVQLQMPKVLNCLDMDVRKWVSEAISRGQVTVRVSPYFEKESPVKVLPNIPLAKELKRAWGEIQKEFGGVFGMEMLKGESGLLIYEDEIEDAAALRVVLEKSVKAALAPLIAMKDVEGKAIEKDFLSRLDKLKELIGFVEAKAPRATEKFREKLRLVLTEVLPNALENQDRLLQEVCIYADKVDIAEEITRFHSHLAQVREVILSPEPSVGKTLEFLLQELGREINTIGAKNSDLEVARTVVEVKTELERIREQVQNVE